MNAAARSHEFWRDRLRVPNYGVSEAADYAGIAAQTIRNWQRLSNRPAPLGHRDAGKRLSYLQLIELAIVAAARKAGVSLRAIRETREYMGRTFHSEFPFAEYRFKHDGKRLFIDCLDLYEHDGDGKVLDASGRGQLAWTAIIGRLQEFDYDEELVTRWHVGGKKSAVVIDPRIQFGKPSVRGVPTWIIAARSDAGEDISAIAKDFGLPKSAVADALAFEGIDSEAKAWSH
jgi:uncharacterized protein (DUF433 family)